MPEENKLPLVETVVPENELSGVDTVVAMTNIWTSGIIEFESAQTNLIHHYRLKLWGIFIDPKPLELSDTVIIMNQLRAANDAKHEEKKAA